MAGVAGEELLPPSFRKLLKPLIILLKILKTVKFVKQCHIKPTFSHQITLKTGIRYIIHYPKVCCEQMSTTYVLCQSNFSCISTLWCVLSVHLFELHFVYQFYSKMATRGATGGKTGKTEVLP